VEIDGARLDCAPQRQGVADRSIQAQNLFITDMAARPW
jgi:hypothetical protein